MDNAPTVAILLSNYNGYPYLYTSLEGICGQTRPADEIIIVDDGSTDQSLRIINEYAQKSPNVKVLINEHNKGLLYSIDRALRECRSDYIAWAASDDFLTPYFLERSLEILQKHPGAGVCFSQFAVFVDGTTQKRIYSKFGMGDAFDLGEKEHFLTPEMFLKRLQRSYIWMSGNTVLARREALLEMGGFLPELRWHADWFGFFVSAMRYGACVIPEVLTFMREAPQSYSRDGLKNKKKQEEVLKNLLSLTYHASFKDVQPFFLNCPLLFSPFGYSILFVMIKNNMFLLAFRYAKARAPQAMRSFGSKLRSYKNGCIQYVFGILKKLKSRARFFLSLCKIFSLRFNKTPFFPSLWKKV